MNAVNSSHLHHEFCPLDTTIKIISGRWKSIILCRLKDQSLHFNELSRQIPECTRRMLALQLKELVNDGILLRVIDGQKISYQLSPLGHRLLPILLEMNDWGKTYLMQKKSSL
ncbi:winged helix-turn-helix transcriptional regulator [Lactococcus kimchii]|uniref:winged helix-turn-helix transcriptional regulator n=1 Tax=Lactococcus sp. S-13 TaxID=2507158 RepID=UPI0010236A62|nr:helix-turn-helix domain-containing protein [Lactococcus sp. S-13]RZI48732.1 transcriptional regulator [Lactococcus sp. S-13]